jgi:drug/metabolite transporter (DMT)-like permease
MYIAEISALAAALCWSFGGLLATNPARALGAVTFNRVRMSLVFVMLSCLALVTGGWWTLSPSCCSVLVASAFVGIFIGDTCFYESIRRLGPRRTGILFATNAPMTALMGYFTLGEKLPASTSIGCALIMAGVFLAVFHGSNSTQRHSFEETRGNLAVGVGLGLFAAFCQAVSLIIARPVLASGIDAVAASALRVGTAALALTATLIFQSPVLRAASPLTPGLLGQVALSGLVGMGLGMTFLLYALAHGPAGLVSTLSATSPVLILPVLWVATKERPAPWAWFGAILAIVGAGCIFNS